MKSRIVMTISIHKGGVRFLFKAGHYFYDFEWRWFLFLSWSINRSTILWNRSNRLSRTPTLWSLPFNLTSGQSIGWDEHVDWSQAEMKHKWYTPKTSTRDFARKPSHRNPMEIHVVAECNQRLTQQLTAVNKWTAVAWESWWRFDVNAIALYVDNNRPIAYCALQPF